MKNLKNWSNKRDGLNKKMSNTNDNIDRKPCNKYPKNIQKKVYSIFLQ